MENRRRSLLWFRLESLLITVVMLAILITGYRLKLFGSLLVQVLLIAGIFGLLVPMRSTTNRLLQIGINVIKAYIGLWFVTGLSFSLGVFRSLIPVQHGILNEGLTYLVFVLWVAMLVPMFRNILFPENRISMQMILGFVIIFGSVELPAINLLYLSNLSHFDDAVTAYLVFIVIVAGLISVMHHWSYRFPSLRINSRVNGWWLLGLTAITLLPLGLSAGSWPRLFTHFALIPVGSSISLLLENMVFNCVKEEFIFRFILLRPLLASNAKSGQRRIIRAVLISSLLFGLWHLQNLSYQNLPVTSLQAIAAVGIGVVYGTTALYTNTLWLTIILHTVVDTFGFPGVKESFAGQTHPSSYLIVFIAITVIISVTVSLSLLLNKHQFPAFKQTLTSFRVSAN